MLERDFKKAIKDNLESSRIDWDKDAFWNELEPKLNDKKSYKLIFVPILFLIACSTYHFWSSTTITNVNPLLKQETPIPSGIKDIDIAENLDSKSTNNVAPATLIKNKTKENTLPINTIEATTLIKPTLNKNYAKNENQYEVRTTSGKETDFVPSFNKQIFTPKSELNISLNHEIKSIDHIAPLPLLSYELSNNEAKNEWLFPELKLTKVSKKSKALNNLSFTLFTSLHSTHQKSETSKILKDDIFVVSNSTGLETVGFGAMLSGTVGKRLWFAGGCSYQTNNIRLDAQRTVLGDVEIVNIEDAFTYVNTSGEQIFIEGDVESRDSEAQSIRHYNKNTSLNIPLRIGYYSIIKKIRIATYLGSTLFFHDKLFGKYVDDELNISSYDGEKISNGFDVKSIDLGFESFIPFKKNIHFSLGFNVSKTLLETNEDAFIKPNYAYGATLGISYNLKN